jgi:hypothetical protein
MILNLNRGFCFSYVAAKAACQAHQASLAELQRQLQGASLRDSELIQLREALERVVAEKERYKVSNELFRSHNVLCSIFNAC